MFPYLLHLPMFALVSGWVAQRLTASFDAFHNDLAAPGSLLGVQTIALLIGRLDGRRLAWQYVTPSFALWFLLSLSAGVSSAHGSEAAGTGSPSQ